MPRVPAERPPPSPPAVHTSPRPGLAPPVASPGARAPNRPPGLSSPPRGEGGGGTLEDFVDLIEDADSDSAPPPSPAPAAGDVIDLVSDSDSEEREAAAPAGVPHLSVGLFPSGRPAKRARTQAQAPAAPRPPASAPAFLARDFLDSVLVGAGPRSPPSGPLAADGTGTGTGTRGASTLVGMWERSAKRAEERGGKRDPVVLKRSCPCRQGDCEVLTVRKEGSNQGRQFFRCPRHGDADRDCGYFAWKGPAPRATGPPPKPQSRPVSRFGEGRDAARRRGVRGRSARGQGASAAGPYSSSGREAAVDVGWGRGGAGGGWEGVGVAGEGLDVDAL